MPQMSPMMWMLLLLFFIMILLIFNVLNYFNVLIINKNEKKLNFEKPSKFLYWKW